MAKIVDVEGVFKIEIQITRVFIEDYKLERIYRYAYYLKWGFDLISEIPESSTVYFEFPPFHLNYTKDYLEFFLEKLNEKYNLKTSQIDELLFLSYAFSKNPKQKNLREIASYEESNLIYKLVTTPIAMINKANVDEFLHGNSILEKDDDLYRLIISYASPPHEQFISNNKLDRTKIKQAIWDIIFKNLTMEVNVSVIVDGYLFIISKDIQLLFNVNGRKIAKSTPKSQNTKILTLVLKELIEDVKYRDPNFFEILVKHQEDPKNYAKKLKQYLNLKQKVDYKPTFKYFISLMSRYLDKEEIKISVGNKVSRNQKKIIFHYLTMTGLLLREGKFEPYVDLIALKRQIQINKEKKNDDSEFDVKYLNGFC
ncbi:hypothetical protein KXQ82_10330 [Mucilaginibacter sp. HMF5004]|uniref:hypothetical protein n=1 Tax=Mucilaginibacter rivuli TaxID=2857527 RepID=UPI001C6037D1|nr:hypothetical protein [Mucilaginibacter rivuli]MBW4890115.1 hypothetical protein [Mucilaginibacter rivuli]